MLHSFCLNYATLHSHRESCNSPWECTSLANWEPSLWHPKLFSISQQMFQIIYYFSKRFKILSKSQETLNPNPGEKVFWNVLNALCLAPSTNFTLYILPLQCYWLNIISKSIRNKICHFQSFLLGWSLAKVWQGPKWLPDTQQSPERSVDCAE